MADFDRSYERMILFEKGYVFDPDDAGGETIDGISRKFNPDWSGWGIVDSFKNIANFPINLAKSSELQTLIKEFYCVNYWNKFNGNLIDGTKQIVADELLECGVNMSLNTSVKYLQNALNCLNSNGKLYVDLIVDGDCGNKTIDILNKLKQSDVYFVYVMMNIQQGNHYMEIMKSNETQEKWARGWLNRINIYKSI
jgi:lysozyme family protein